MYEGGTAVNIAAHLHVMRHTLAGVRDNLLVLFYQQLLKILLFARRWNY